MAAAALQRGWQALFGSPSLWNTQPEHGGKTAIQKGQNLVGISLILLAFAEKAGEEVSIESVANQMQIV